MVNINMENNMENGFIKANTMGAGSAFTENGAVSYASIGTALLDQFGKAGTARGREYSTVWSEQASLWNEDQDSAIRFPFYLRMITRKTNIIGNDKSTDSVMRGQGAKDEAFKRLLWFAAYHPDVFYRNLWVLPIVGSWKDLWQLMYMARVDSDKMPVSDLKLDETKFFALMSIGMTDAHHKDLVLKYMPRIRSEKKCTTPWARVMNSLAKELAAWSNLSYKEYRESKSAGLAHNFQKIITSGEYEKLKWGSIPGKALLNLVSGKFLTNHNLSNAYVEWLNGQPTVKFNGYVYELFRKIVDVKSYRPAVHGSLATIVTADKQFEGMIKTAKSGDGQLKGNVLCCLDTSGSMTSSLRCGLTAFDVCVSLGVYFSSLNEGWFKDVVCMFDDKSTLLKLSGTFSEKINEILCNGTAWGGTDFQSVISMLIDTRKNNPNIKLEDYPTTLLVVSDMQFNRYGSESNIGAAKRRMKEVFPAEYVDNLKFVWWYCTDRVTSDFPMNMDCGGSYMFSGFDGAIVSMLLGGEEKVDESGNKVQPTMQEVVYDALHQDVLNTIR